MLARERAGKLDRPLLYRKFRRCVILATATLFAIGLLVALLLRIGGSVWVTATWTAISSPIVVGIAICMLAPIERMALNLGLSRAGVLPRIRPTAVFWIISGIGLPWIAAWLMADVMGNSFEIWWRAKSVGGADFYLWTVRLVARVATYSLACALGLFLAYFFDHSMEDGAGQDS
jgi:hypothetical protein